MKKIFGSLLSAALILSLAACGGEKKPEAGTATDTPAPAVSAPVESAPAEEGKSELQLGMAYGDPHGNKSFGCALAAVSGDRVVAAFFDEFQFVDANAGLNTVPNSDAANGLAAGFAEGQALASKRWMADYYSALMADHAGSTVRIDDNFDAIQAYAVGKTIDELEAVAGGDAKAATDTVSGATLADTAGYLGLIAQAARNAQTTQAVEFDGDASQLKLNGTYGMGNGNQGFALGAALTDGETIVLSYLDEIQFVDANAGLDTVPNSDAADGLAAGFAEGQALASKRCVADYYSELMASYAGSTVRIDDNFDAIQAHVNGMTISEAKALSADSNAVDAVSGATLASTAEYVGVIAAAAEG